MIKKINVKIKILEIQNFEELFKDENFKINK